MWFAIRPLQRLLIDQNTAGTAAASKALVLGTSKDVDHLEFLSGTGAASAGILHGGGTSVAPNTSALAANFMSYYNSSSAATGTARGLYNRLYLTGGAGGEALRSFTTVSHDTPADTVNGAHISLNFGATTGNATGTLGLGSRNTLHIPDRALGGNVAAVQAELWADGSSSDVSQVCSLFRAIVDGDGTGKDTVSDKAYFLDLTCNDTAGGMVENQTSWAVSKSLKVRVNGTDYYLALSTAA